MPKPALTGNDVAAVDAILADDDARRIARYPGAGTSRQPVHTAYVPADRVHADLAADWGEAAIGALRRDAADAEAFAHATGIPADEVASVWDRIQSKLGVEPIEDLRVDLEDGYGDRGDDEEDAHAWAAGQAVAAALAKGALPPYSGTRFKSLEATTRARGVRSLDLVLGGILDSADLPGGWVQTMPKATTARQVTAMVELCSRLESAYGLNSGRLAFEIQIETSQAILGPDGCATVAEMIEAAEGRCTGLHFGTYDYTAALGIAGGYQSMDHPAADHAKSVLQLAVAGTRVRVSDGSTNVLPVGARDQVHKAWELHARLVRRSLERGFYQGWDLHPAQLPTRYLSTYLFFRRDLESLGGRLRRYLEGVEGAVMDEPATAQAMAAFLLRALRCGAVDADELTAVAGCGEEVLTSLAERRVG